MPDEYIIGGDAKDKEKGDEESPKIHVDEDWKQRARRERQVDARAAEAQAEDQQKRSRPRGPEEPLPEPSLPHLIMSFATQALFGLGEAENPAAGKKEVDLEWAKFNIDMLQMLEDKTRGNVTPEEKNMFVQLLYDLRMRYVKAVG
jgi:hypothetical protein